jgi:hypothetical protein
VVARLSHLSLGFGLVGNVNPRRPHSSLCHRKSGPPAGTLNGGAVLDDDTIRAIRESTGTQRDIARQFNTSQPNVSKIKARKVWGHVE